MIRLNPRIAALRRPRIDFCLNARQARRRGFTLIEMIGVIGLVAMILSLSATTLHHAFAAHQSSIQHFRHLQSLELLMQRLRSDCHASVTASLEEGLKLSRADGRDALYTFDAPRCKRTVFENGAVVGTESWELPAGANLIWELDRSQHVPLAIAKIDFDREILTCGPMKCWSRCELHELP